MIKTNNDSFSFVHVSHVNFTGYGMTECLVTHIQPMGERKPGSAGVLLANMEGKVYFKIAPVENVSEKHCNAKRNPGTFNAIVNR